MEHGDPRRKFLVRMAALGGSVPLIPYSEDRTRSPIRGRIINVREHGATGDGISFDTKPIQAVIDGCAESGGGTIYFPAGEYLTGTLRLKSRVCLYLDAGAKLTGSKNLLDYPAIVPGIRSYTDNYTEKSLLYGERIEGVSILGQGTIDGQGAAFKGEYKLRPYMMRFVECRNIRLEDVTLQNSPMWVQHYLACEDVFISRIRVHSRVNDNNDGIDIDCCDRVQISDCEISSGDDAIVLKSSSPFATRNVAITNCILSSGCNALKMGTESNGGFENIAISNCVIHDTRLAALTLQIVDGGILDGVVISGITMNQVGAPIFVRLGNRGRPPEPGDARLPVGRLRNVSISDVVARGASDVGCAIAGLPDHPVENLSVENVRLYFKGGGSRDDAHRQVPEWPEKYPEFDMFGQLPAYAFFVRHARNLRFSNVSVGFDQSEIRPGMSFEDVEGLDIDGVAIAGSSDGEPLIKLYQVRECLMRGCRIPWPVSTFIQIAGERSDGITIMGNDLRRAQKAVDIVPNVARSAVYLLSNRTE